MIGQLREVKLSSYPFPFFFSLSVIPGTRRWENQGWADVSFLTTRQETCRETRKGFIEKLKPCKVLTTWKKSCVANQSFIIALVVGGVLRVDL